MEFVKINDTTYPAVITGRLEDNRYSKKSTSTIRMQATYSEIIDLFKDNCTWSIISDGEEFDKSDYNKAGPITDFRNGYIEIIMIKEPQSDTIDNKILSILLGEEV